MMNTAIISMGVLCPKIRDQLKNSIAIDHSPMSNIYQGNNGVPPQALPMGSPQQQKIVLTDRDYSKIIKAETRRHQQELAGLYGAQINNRHQVDKISVCKILNAISKFCAWQLLNIFIIETIIFKKLLTKKFFLLD